MHQSQISLLKNKEELATSGRLLAIGDWLFLLIFLGATGKIYCKEKSIDDWIYEYYILMRIHWIWNLSIFLKLEIQLFPLFLHCHLPFLLCWGVMMSWVGVVGAGGSNFQTTHYLKPTNPNPRKHKTQIRVIWEGPYKCFAFVVGALWT